MAETRARMLGELAELGLVLARELQQAALVAEDVQEKVRLADAFARVGRGLRQSLALHARMERESARDARDAEAEAPRMEPALRARRKAQIRDAVAAVIWREHERLDAEPDLLLEELDLHLAAEVQTDGFLERDPSAEIARLCRAFDLPLPAAASGADPTDSASTNGPASPSAAAPPRARPAGAAPRVTARRTDPHWLSSG
jgi:hypothetical protein